MPKYLLTAHCQTEPHSLALEVLAPALAQSLSLQVWRTM